MKHWVKGWLCNSNNSVLKILGNIRNLGAICVPYRKNAFRRYIAQTTDCCADGAQLRRLGRFEVLYIKLNCYLCATARTVQLRIKG